MILLITYDLKKPGQSYRDLHEAIKGSGTSWWHYLESTWLIDTGLSAEQVFGRLKPHVDRNDHVFITRIVRPYQGWLPAKAWEWINARQSAVV